MIVPDNQLGGYEDIMSRVKWEMFYADQASHPAEKVPHLQEAIRLMMTAIFGDDWEGRVV